LVEKGQAEIKTGPFGTQLHASDYVDTGTPVINARNIGFGNIRVDKLEYISDETVKRLSSHLLRPADIVFGRKGTVERHAFIQQAQNNWFQGTDCLRLRLKSPDVEPRYVSYYLTTEHHKQWIINQSSHGATMTSLNQDIISRISFPLPPLPIQRKIADVLSAYDDLIEVNTRRIRILEQMAQSVYREWFGKTDEKSLPEGWEIKKLGDVVELAYGKGLKADQRIDGLYPVYGSAGVVGYHNEFLVKSPGIIVGRKGNVGSVFWSNKDFFPIDTTYFVRTDISLYYVFFNLHTQNFINNDAAVPGLSRSQAYSLPFLVPSKIVLDKFDDFVAPIFQQLEILTAKNANLRRTRDLLLPRLVSGEVGVEQIKVDQNG